MRHGHHLELLFLVRDAHHELAISIIVQRVLLDFTHVDTLNVLRERRLLLERFVAELACEGTVIAVSQLVTAHVVGTGEVFVANVTNVQRHLVGLHFAFLLLAGRRVFPQLDLARKHGFAELALEYRARLFFLFVRAAHLLHVLAQVGQPTKRVLAVFTLERPLVLVSCSHVHREGRVVSKCSTTTTQ